jgi:hypothetical protein
VYDFFLNVDNPPLQKLLHSGMSLHHIHQQFFMYGLMGQIPIYSLFVNELFYKVNFADLKKNAFSIYLDKIVPN